MLTISLQQAADAQMCQGGGRMGGGMGALMGGGGRGGMMGGGQGAGGAGMMQMMQLAQMAQQAQAAQQQAVLAAMQRQQQMLASQRRQQTNGQTAATSTTAPNVSESRRNRFRSSSRSGRTFSRREAYLRARERRRQLEAATNEPTQQRSDSGRVAGTPQSRGAGPLSS
ncbi:MAG: hypothetical protein ACYTGL_05325 [Planctomycetota bacterium]|jgi:hypothetical protein